MPRRLPDSLRSLHNPNYRRYAGGQVVSLVGTWMQSTAQDWLVLQLGGAGLGLGFVLALQFGPSLLFSLYGGLVADRYDKRRILLITQSTMAVLALTLGLLVVTHTVTLPMVFAVATVLGCVNAFDVPARQSFVVEMVGPDDLTNAVALNSVTFNLARVVGPAVAGLLVAWLGTGPAFLLNAASYGAVLLGLGTMRTELLRPARRVARAKGQVIEGLRYVRHRLDLLLPIFLIGVIGTFGYNFPITLALMARSEFHGGAAAYGMLSSIFAIGSLGGALLAARRKRPRQRLLLGAAAAFGLTEAIAGLAPSLPALAILLVPVGFAALSINTAANSTVQLGAGEVMRGRVMSLYVLVMMGGTPFGAPLIGWLSQRLGPRAGLVAGGLICLVASLGAGFLLWRRNRRLAAETQTASARALPARQPSSAHRPVDVLSSRAASTLAAASRSNRVAGGNG